MNKLLKKQDVKNRKNTDFAIGISLIAENEVF